MTACNTRQPFTSSSCRCDKPAGHDGDCECYGYTAGVGVATTVLTRTHNRHRWWLRDRIITRPAEEQS
jgi:hypothetical protein